MNKYVVTIALVNGMIGGLILVLPILAMNGGTVLSFLVILVTGLFSFYSCYLCLIHLGKNSDLDKAILQHFNNSKIMRALYDFLVFLNLLFLLMLYFNLIVTQWRGLLPYNIASPICNAIALLVLTIALNYFHFGAKLLGYGIISIVGYCIFLAWLIGSAPSGPNTIPLFGTGAVNLAASMGQAFSIQTFFIPVLKQLPDPQNYAKYTGIAYGIGGCVYMYIAFAGSFGILNRQTVPPGIIPQTIQGYFQTGQWQMAIVQVIYLIHLYSAYGEFLLICKKRFFSIFGFKQSKHGGLLSINQVIFVIGLIGITVGIFFGNVGIGTLIQINGAILGFFFIYLLPAAMHFVCIYLNPNKKNKVMIQIQKQIVQIPENSARLDEKMIQLQKIDEMRTKSVNYVPNYAFQGEYEGKQTISQRNHDSSASEPKVKSLPTPTILKTVSIEPLIVHTCTCKRLPMPFLLFDFIAMVGMVALGAFIMVQGFISVIQGQS